MMRKSFNFEVKEERKRIVGFLRSFESFKEFVKVISRSAKLKNSSNLK